MSGTKIVATIGPASSSPEALRGLVDAGMDVARLNLSHGELEEHIEVVRRVRAAASTAGRAVAVLADLPGPKPRTGELGTEGIELGEGERWRLTSDGAPTRGVLPVDEPDFLAHVGPGDEIVLGDATATLDVDEIGPDGVVATVRLGGVVRGRPGIRVVGASRPGLVPTARDLALLAPVVDAGVDFVGVSFVLGADDLRRVRSHLPADGGRPMPLLVAKIETAAAVDALDAIVSEADAVMVARGDLGISCPLEDVPHLQKRIIGAALGSATPVITATQMLESMTTADEPTRAEVSDVANAVLDGTDAVMLSGETAIGVDPVHVVATMRRIADRADAARRSVPSARALGSTTDVAIEDRITDAIARAACQVAEDLEVAAILCCTRTGASARAIARGRPRIRLVGLAPEGATRRRLAVSWGVEPLAMPEPVTDVAAAMRAAKDAGVVSAGDAVAIVAGMPDSLRVLVVP